MSSRSAAVKRLMKEYADLEQDPSPEFVAYPINNVFEWHFTLRGPDEGGFKGGEYHGRIVFPVDYPFKPPDMVPCGNLAAGMREMAPSALLITLIKNAPHVPRTVSIGLASGIKMKDLLTDELLDSERKKVEGADEISNYSKGSTESVAGTPAVVDDAVPPFDDGSPAQSPVPASLTKLDSSVRAEVTELEEGLRQPVEAPVSANARTASAVFLAAPARVFSHPSVKYIRFHTRRSQIDTVILGLTGLIFYVVLRRLGIIFSSR